MVLAGRGLFAGHDLWFGLLGYASFVCFGVGKAVAQCAHVGQGVFLILKQIVSIFLVVRLLASFISKQLVKVDFLLLFRVI